MCLFNASSFQLVIRIQTIFIDDKNKRYDANTNQHVHFMCNGCAEITDLPIKSLSIETENDSDFAVTEYHFYYRGYCKKCG